MKKLVISVVTDEGKKYIKKGFLGSKTVSTVELEDATLYSKPDDVEWVLANYELPSPVIEVVDIQISKSLESAKEKYLAYAEML